MIVAVRKPKLQYFIENASKINLCHQNTADLLVARGVNDLIHIIGLCQLVLLNKSKTVLSVPQ